MRERATVELPLPVPYAPPPRISSSRATSPSSTSAGQPLAPRLSTTEETYALYEQGLTIEEICETRGLTEITVEKHLADSILAGRAFDVSRHVTPEARAMIERVAEEIGHERMKPIRDALPRHITYRMIRFVLADLQRARGE